MPLAGFTALRSLLDGASREMLRRAMDVFLFGAFCTFNSLFHGENNAFIPSCRPARTGEALSVLYSAGQVGAPRPRRSPDGSLGAGGEGGRDQEGEPEPLRVTGPSR